MQWKHFSTADQNVNLGAMVSGAQAGAAGYRSAGEAIAAGVEKAVAKRKVKKAEQATAQKMLAEEHARTREGRPGYGAY